MKVPTTITKEEYLKAVKLIEDYNRSNNTHDDRYMTPCGRIFKTFDNLKKSQYFYDSYSRFILTENVTIDDNSFRMLKLENLSNKTELTTQKLFLNTIFNRIKNSRYIRYGLDKDLVNIILAEDTKDLIKIIKPNIKAILYIACESIEDYEKINSIKRITNSDFESHRRGDTLTTKDYIVKFIDKSEDGDKFRVCKEIKNMVSRNHWGINTEVQSMKLIEEKKCYDEYIEYTELISSMKDELYNKINGVIEELKRI